MASRYRRDGGRELFISNKNVSRKMVERVKIEVASGRGVAESWRKQYQHGDKWTQTVRGDSELVYNNLCKLGENPDIDAVAKVTGNKGWSYLTCSSCGEHVKRAADLTRHYADNQNLICRPCLEDAIRAMDAA